MANVDKRERRVGGVVRENARSPAARRLDREHGICALAHPAQGAQSPLGKDAVRRLEHGVEDAIDLTIFAPHGDKVKLK